MTISSLPTAPNRATNTPQQFSDNMDAMLSALVTMVNQYNTDLSGLNAMSAMAPLSYTFSTTTTDADPGTGVIRLGSATQNAATVIRMDASDTLGISQQTFIDTFDDSTSSVKGMLRIAHRDDPGGKYLLFAVTAVDTSPVGYRNITVNCVSSSAASPFTNTAPLLVSFARTGDAGLVVDGQSSVSNRNKIRNGRMDFAQRGASLTNINAAASGYMLDGWRYNASGTAGVVTCSQAVDAPSDNEFQSSFRVTVTTQDAVVSVGDLVTIYQPIEGYLVRDLINKPIAIQFRVRSPKTGTHHVALVNGGNDRSYVMPYTVNAANTWETKFLTLPVGLVSSAGTWNWTTGVGVSLHFCLMGGATYQTTAGAWQTGLFYAASGQVNCMDLVGNIFAITGVQLEKGGASGPFEHRDMSAETLANQRYLLAPSNMFGVQYATTASAISYTFPVSMRASPTSTLSVASATSIGVGAMASIAGFSTATLNNQFGQFQFTHTAIGVIGQPMNATMAGLLSAEL